VTAFSQRSAGDGKAWRIGRLRARVEKMPMLFAVKFIAEPNGYQEHIVI